jgi:lipid II:glycine glycyltransferase (peptidoglycan interpeptide bridge formation enzyme)
VEVALADIRLNVSRDSEAIHWNEVAANLPGAHILQTSYWAEIKADLGWRVAYLLWQDASDKILAAAMVLEKKAPLIDARILYCPRGPLLDWSDLPLVGEVINSLADYARSQKAIYLKIDPNVQVGSGLPGAENYAPGEIGMKVKGLLDATGWIYSGGQIQFKNTVTLDLCQGEEALLAGMKQKMRYNIQLARRKGMNVRLGTAADYKQLYRMYAVTALRDGFAIRDEAYYLKVWQRLSDAGLAYPLLAEVDGRAVAGMVMFTFGGTAYYFYGMSTGEDREKMPNHLLQWEAIRLAETLGCTRYDLWGAPDAYDEADPMWGVYRFKEGFNGETSAGLGAYDLILQPTWYAMLERGLPAVLALMRRLGRRRIQSEVNQ